MRDNAYMTGTNPYAITLRLGRPFSIIILEPEAAYLPRISFHNRARSAWPPEFVPAPMAKLSLPPHAFACHGASCLCTCLHVLCSSIARYLMENWRALADQPTTNCHKQSWERC